MGSQKIVRKTTWGEIVQEMQNVGATDAEGWTTVTPDGWDSFHVRVLIGADMGYPRVIGLRLEPKAVTTEEEFDACVLTSARLRSFPLQEIADAVMGGTSARRKALAKLRRERKKDPAVKSDVRQKTTLQAVVDAYKSDTSGAPQRHVEVTLGLTSRTAARYIQMARERRLLPPSRTSKGTTTRKGQQ